MEINQNQSQPELSEHEQAMVDKVNENEQKTQEAMKPDSEIEPGQEQQQEEQLYAGKYKSIEEMEKAYKELESKLGNKDETQTQEDVQPEEKAEPQTEQEAKDIAEEKGIDYNAVENEFNENGSLSEDTYQSLADKGIPKEMVDAYIAGQQAMATQAQTRLQALAGGEEGYNQMIGWATENLSESEIQAFNGSLSNEAAAEFAIQGLYSRFKAEQGPNLVKPGKTAPQGTSGYQSKAEMTRDMHDPRYRTDPAFRSLVASKIAKANF